MGRTSRGMQDVELVEVDLSEPDATSAGLPDVTAAVDADAATDLAGDPASGRRRARGGWRRWWPLAAVVVLVLALATPSVVHAQRERSRLDRLAGLPGYLTPLDGPVSELWRTDGWSSGYQPVQVGDRLVGAWSGMTDRVDVRGLDVTSGTTVWSHALSVAASESGICVVTAGSGSARAVAVCRVVDETAPYDANDESAGSRASAVHLAVYDAETGEQVASIPADPSDGLLAVDDDIVVTSMDATARANVVRRLDPRTGATVWTSTHPAAGNGSGGVQSAYLASAGDAILVQGGTGAWLLSHTGEVLREWTLGQDTIAVLPRAGGRLFTVARAGADGDYALTDAQSGAAIEAPAGWMSVEVTEDGSRPRVWFALGDVLTAFDLDSGARLWATDGAVTGAVVVDGTVYLADSTGLHARDVRTGHERWAVDPQLTDRAGFGLLSAVVTDGRVVLVAGSDAKTAGSVIRAFDLEDGRLAWEAPLDHTTAGLSVIQGRLYSQSADGSLVALG